MFNGRLMPNSACGSEREGSAGGVEGAGLIWAQRSGIVGASGPKLHGAASNENIRSRSGVARPQNKTIKREELPGIVKTKHQCIMSGPLRWVMDETP